MSEIEAVVNGLLTDKDRRRIAMLADAKNLQEQHMFMNEFPLEERVRLWGVHVAFCNLCGVGNMFDYRSEIAEKIERTLAQKNVPASLVSALVMSMLVNRSCLRAIKKHYYHDLSLGAQQTLNYLAPFEQYLDQLCET